MTPDALRKKATYRFTIVVCGDIVARRGSLSDIGPAGSEVTVVRCSEDEDTLTLCPRLAPAMILARQAFIARFPADFVQLTDYGHGPYVLAVMGTDDLDGSSMMLRVGCRGVLPPRFSNKTLRNAVAAVLDGEICAPPKVIAVLMSDLLRAAARGDKTVLTPREQHIRDLIAQGYKNSAIADALFISPATVRWHKRRLYRKMRESGDLKRSAGRISLQSPESAAG